MSTTPIDVTKESPFDYEDVSASPALVQIAPLGKKERLLPSKYNVRTTGHDGSYIVWNTYSGSISVFKPEQKRVVQRMLQEGYTGEVKGVVRYLSERGLLVAEGANEYRQIQLGFGQTHYRQDILELILLASEDCNFRCEYCYEDFPRGTMLPSVREGVKKMVERRAAGLRQLTVGWFGGEPLYGFKAIEDLAPYLLELAEQYDINYTSHITTNAYLLTPDVAEKLLAWKVNYFQVTIDGPAEQHDKKRPARDGSGTFHTILENLRALKAREDDYFVKLRVNYDRETYPHLEELLLIIQSEFGGDERFGIAFHGVGRWGGQNDAALPVCGLDESRQVKDQLRASALEKGLNLKGTLRDMNSPGRGVCYAARPYNFIVGADGKLMKCTVVLDKADHNIVGQLTKDGDLALKVDNYALWVEPAFENDKGCQKCSLLPSCQGISCPLIRIEESKSPCAATPKMDLRRELLAVLETARFKANEVVVSQRE